MMVLALPLGAGSLGAQATGRQWQLGPRVFSIGSETDVNAQFSRIVNCLLLPDSGVAVVNGGSMQVRFFDSVGRFVRHVGREGGGPGEYRFFDRAFRLAGDSLGIYDGSLRRVTVLSPTGEFARTVTLARPSGVTGMGGPTPVGGFADGSIVSYAAPSIVPGAGQERRAVHRRIATFFRHAATGEFILTLGESPGGEQFLELTDGMVVNWAIPFQRMF